MTLAFTEKQSLYPPGLLISQNSDVKAYDLVFMR